MIQALAPSTLLLAAAYCIATFRPQGATTFCNFSVEHAARLYGCRDFTRPDGRPLMANEICRGIADSPNWREVTSSYEDAQTLANAGRLLVTAKALQPHGHVAWLVPGSMRSSGGYGGMVPLICNAGPEKWHGITGLSFGYSLANRPKIYIYEPKEK